MSGVEKIVLHLVAIRRRVDTRGQAASGNRPKCRVRMKAPVTVAPETPQDGEDNQRSSNDRNFPESAAEEFHAERKADQ